MSFREQSRWVALVANLLLWSYYFGTFWYATITSVADERVFFWRLIWVLFVTVVINVAGNVVIAVRNPGEANRARDERDRMIEKQASATAYSLLSVGLALVLIGSYLKWDKFGTVNALLFVFIVAETVRYVSEIVAYRRGLA